MIDLILLSFHTFYPKGALAPLVFLAFAAFLFQVGFYVNQRLITLCRFSLSVGVDASQVGAYISASLLLTQQTKQAVL